jgi:hypothetical protein
LLTQAHLEALGRPLQPLHRGREHQEGEAVPPPPLPIRRLELARDRGVVGALHILFEREKRRAQVRVERGNVENERGVGLWCPRPLRRRGLAA